MNNKRYWFKEQHFPSVLYRTWPISKEGWLTVGLFYTAFIALGVAIIFDVVNEIIGIWCIMIITGTMFFVVQKRQVPK